jgi:hypothetical protein
MRRQTLRLTRLTGVLALVLLLSSAFLAGATEIQGRLSSTSYVYETYGEDAHSELDLINRLAFDARGLGHKSLSLHLLGTFRGEMLHEDSDDPEMSFYRGYLKFAPSKLFKLSVGRQWIYGGVGSSLLDGARLDLNGGKLGALTLFTGSRKLSDEDGDTFPNFEDIDGVMGAHYRYYGLPMKGMLGLSAARYTEEEELLEQRVGASLWFGDFPLGSLAYEMRYETESEMLYFSHLRLSGKKDVYDYGVTWNMKEGYLPNYTDSWITQLVRDEEWFADGALSKRQELRIQAGFPCRAIDGFRWTAAVVEIFPEVGDRGDGFELSLAGKGLKAGFRMQRGYRGDRTGFFGSYRHKVLEDTWLWVDLNRMAYKYGDESISEQAVSDDYSMASRVGIDHYCTRFPLELRLIFESLTNPRAEYENRFIGMVAYRFGTSHGEED